MKKIICIIACSCLVIVTHAQNVGIGTTTPAPSAALDISATQKGFLPPRLTVSQRNNIPSPVAGLMIWCTDIAQLQVFDGSVWLNLTGTKAILASVPIGSQVWTTKNLSITSYSNGDSIPQAFTTAQWTSATTGLWCWYNNDSATYAATYGRLYNWYAANDPRGLAPAGWHIPTDAEWGTLITYAGGSVTAGNSLKEAGTTHWLAPNTGATNAWNFTALPGGFRTYNTGAFSFLGSYGGWWTQTEGGTLDAIDYEFQNTNGNALHASDFKKTGFSVRCVKDY